MANRGRNELLVPGAQQVIDQFKYEIATEFGVQLGSDTVSRSNGSVGGEITKRLVAAAQQQLSGLGGSDSSR
ncbi:MULTISPECIES: alpha/beta-type small acid-soluble spore protein [Fictibacillus]|uniref:Alpha/beta-type small acid-soluble spore protein n=1 Tax=Fictibacillus terranigra TaxID=3058424 RepID=A0ABT8E4J3_9BACL|nr:alpha/beta-type small acid-soluble spore protein [Fictibacillus sp. CENA-BCM004]MDN4072822.1 alpha/beta-type small acid-soluble spore protein [Fictibacillus sp. CENA-BCM004]